MRVLFFGLLLVAATAVAQQAPRTKEEVTKEGRRISDLMNADDQKLKPLPVTLTPPEKLFANKGQATMLYALPINKPPAYQAYLRFVMDQHLFQEALDAVNGLAALPRNMVVFFRDCGEANAFYDPKSGNITFCFELVKEFDELYSNPNQTPEETRELVRGAVFFVFFHEFGHALAHELGLPLTGKEEDAVDQFATLLLLEQGERGEQAALSGAAYFLALGSVPGKKLAFWDEHSLDSQRFFNIACWLYGASPFHQVNLVAKGLLPASRAARCGNEFQQMRRSWKISPTRS